MKKRAVAILVSLLLCVVFSAAGLAKAPQTAQSFTADNIAAGSAVSVRLPIGEEIGNLVNRLAACGVQLPSFAGIGQLDPAQVAYSLFYLAITENGQLLKQGQGVAESARAQYEREAAASGIWASFFARRSDMERMGREIFGEAFSLPESFENAPVTPLPGREDVCYAKTLEGPPFRLYYVPVDAEDLGGGAFAARFHSFRVYFDADGPTDAEGKRGGFYEPAGTFAPGAERDLPAAFDRFQLSVPENTLDKITVTFRRHNGKLIITSVDDTPWPVDFLTRHVDLPAVLGHANYIIMAHPKSFRNGNAYYGVSVGSNMGDHIASEEFYFVAEDRSRIYQENLTGKDFLVYEAD